MRAEATTMHIQQMPGDKFSGSGTACVEPSDLLLPRAGGSAKLRRFRLGHLSPLRGLHGSRRFTDVCSAACTPAPVRFPLRLGCSHLPHRVDSRADSPLSPLTACSSFL